MKLVNLNSSKQDLIEYIAAANISDPAAENQLIGFRQSMFFNIGNDVTENSVIDMNNMIIEIIVIRQLLKEGKVAKKDKKLVEVTPTEFSNIIKEIEKVK